MTLNILYWHLLLLTILNWTICQTHPEEAESSPSIIPTVKYGGGSIILSSFFGCRKDWCTLQNRWNHEEKTLCENTEATCQDISQEAKAWGFPNGQ